MQNQIVTYNPTCTLTVLQEWCSPDTGACQPDRLLCKGMHAARPSKLPPAKISFAVDIKQLAGRLLVESQRHLPELPLHFLLEECRV